MLSTAKYAQGATPDEAQIKTYYEAHKADYMTPESVDLHYAEISLARLSEQVKVDDAQLKAYYEEQKTKTPDRFVQEEQRRVRHILFTVNDPKEDAAAKSKAEGVLKRVQAGEDFAKLAKEFSQDPASAQQGGDLGFSKKGDFVGPFADSAFAMKPDEIRGPVKTQFGYHILQLEAIQPPATKTFEQARPELETEYRRNEAERLYNDAADKLADAALQNAADLDGVAKQVGLSVEEIPSFTRKEGGGALGHAQPVIDAAFSQDVLDGHLSPIIEVDKGRGVVLRASEHKMPAQKPLESVHDAVLAAWKKQRGAELAAAAAKDALKRLNDGQPWDAVVKSLGLSAPPPKYLSRADQDLPFEVRSAVFQSAKPADKKSVFASVDLPDGDAVLYALSAVRENPADDGPKDPELKREYANRVASGEAQSYTAGARQDASVTVNAQAID